MSRHEGVSCDSCLKGNFRGKRYKCLVCYDYDLCAQCYESGATTTRHSANHPMQCILTRSDFELYYGGEIVTVDQPQSFTCPYCGKMGYTENTLHEHVTSDHSNVSSEVVCPICAALPGGDPNHVTDDFTTHLTLEHRHPREIHDEPVSSRHVRRMFHPGRGGGGPRRRPNMQFSSLSAVSNQSNSLPTSRDSIDPIAELLSQLGVRRSPGQSISTTASQLQQLQLQLQLERQQAQAVRQHLERLPRRMAGLSATSTAVTSPATATTVTSQNNTASTAQNSQYLLARSGDASLSQGEREERECERTDRSTFVQDLLLSLLSSTSSESLETCNQISGEPAGASGAWSPGMLTGSTTVSDPQTPPPPPSVKHNQTHDKRPKLVEQSKRDRSPNC